MRVVYPDQFQFEVWAHRYNDAAAVKGSRSRLMASEAPHSIQTIEGLEALVFEETSAQG